MPSPIHLILDWDGTLTTTSTLPLIAQTGYDLNASFAQPHQLPSWNSISEAYTSDYHAHSNAYTPCAAERNSIEQELAWLESLRYVEGKSMERVEAGGIFRGVRKKDVQRAADEAVREGKVVLRKGWERLIDRVVSANGEVGIVSVGWSGDFIRGCLEAAVRRKNVAEENGVGSGDYVARIDIRANEITGVQDGKMSRYFEENGKGGEGGIWTARQKRMVMEDMTRKSKRGIEESLVYVGDSMTDLECLLSADFGVSVWSEGEMTGEQLDLEQALKRLGIDSRWIGQMRACDVEAEHGTNRTEMKGYNLWWARDFDDILESLLFNAGNESDICPASRAARISPESEISNLYLSASFKTHSHIQRHKTLIHHS
ncbi:MAG: hypothetical protein LQ343_001916 [Gyalolechia ehrenbergii]|nr:MAG: hypothetical protein LQ343_001916 [Gyalolechia ehrenbergii]